MILFADIASTQADLGLRCSHMPEDTFSHGVAIMINDKCNIGIRKFALTHSDLSDLGSY